MLKEGAAAYFAAAPSVLGITDRMIQATVQTFAKTLRKDKNQQSRLVISFSDCDKHRLSNEGTLANNIGLWIIKQ